jgi:hypothetical protein
MTREKKHSTINNQQKLKIDVISGFTTGVVCCALFNPWDKALFLSIQSRQPFLSRVHFVAPYQGVSQAIVQRAFLGSIYYISQGQLREHLQPQLRNIDTPEVLTQFITGATAGTVSAILTNPASVVKYHAWGKSNLTFWTSLRQLYRQGGIYSFTRGAFATINRDFIFGAVYEVIRHSIRQENASPPTKFASDLIASSTATLASGPLNYARNIQYATAPDMKVKSILIILQSLWLESKGFAHSPMQLLNFFQQRFRVGWGTGRVGVGMTAGQLLFDTIRNKLSQQYEVNSIKKP